MRREILAACAALLLLAGLAAADLTIPPGQPICNLYGMIQVLGTIASVILAAYAGFILASSHETEARSRSKMLIEGVALGLIVIWLAPIVVQYLVGSTGICGW
jgi:hypothetical protein